MAESEVDEFYSAHVAGGPSNVIAVHAQYKDGRERLGIFSTVEKARAWADSMDHDEYLGAVVVPYIIDIPEYGNVPKGETQ